MSTMSDDDEDFCENCEEPIEECACDLEMDEYDLDDDDHPEWVESSPEERREFGETCRRMAMVLRLHDLSSDWEWQKYWVRLFERCPHVSGDPVDLAATWLDAATEWLHGHVPRVAISDLLGVYVDGTETPAARCEIYARLSDLACEKPDLHIDALSIMCEPEVYQAHAAGTLDEFVEDLIKAKTDRQAEQLQGVQS